MHATPSATSAQDHFANIVDEKTEDAQPIDDHDNFIAAEIEDILKHDHRADTVDGDHYTPQYAAGNEDDVKLRDLEAVNALGKRQAAEMEKQLNDLADENAGLLRGLADFKAQIASAMVEQSRLRREIEQRMLEIEILRKSRAAL
ncbi:hypothetical protein MRB53_041508 [Persea americana]|nr:hypothetical protein MRB53_041508 [Persea americana]